MTDLNRTVYKKRPGDTVEITYYRGKQKRSVKLSLDERPPDM